MFYGWRGEANVYDIDHDVRCACTFEHEAESSADEVA